MLRARQTLMAFRRVLEGEWERAICSRASD
jgi:hypothetical protein